MIGNLPAGFRVAMRLAILGGALPLTGRVPGSGSGIDRVRAERDTTSTRS